MSRATLGRRLQLLVALAALVPLIIVCALAFFWFLPQARQEISANHREMAQAVSFQVSDHLRGAERELTSLGKLMAAQLHLPDYFQETVLDAHVGGGDFFEAIYLVDPRGAIAAVGLPEPRRARREEMQGLDLSGRLFIQKIRSARQPIWSQTFLSVVSGKLAVAHAIEVEDHLLTGEIAISRLTGFIKSLPSQSHLAIAVLDGFGHVVAASRKGMQEQNILLKDHGVSGVGFIFGPELKEFQLAGENYVGTATKVKRLGWRVVLALPRELAEASLRDAMWIMAIGLVSALLLSLGTGWAVARGVSGDFRRLANQATAIAQGDYDRPRPVSSIEEFSNLGDDLRQMAGAIRQRERELAGSEARLIRAQAVGHIGSWELDLATGKVWASREAFRIYGLAPGASQILDLRKAQELPLAEDRPRLDQGLRDLLEKDSPYDLEFRIKRADNGELRWVHSMAELDRAPDGSPAKVLGVLQDVTERRDLEVQLLQSQKLEAIGLLAGGVAHDFNNMLSVILGYTELMQNGLAEDFKDYKRLEQIAKAASHSRDITRQLLAFSRKQIIDPSPQDLNRLIEGTSKTMVRLIGEDVSLSVHPSPDAWLVKLDPSQVDQILVNLAVNARDAMPEGGHLLFELGNTVLDEGYCRNHPEAKPGSFVVLAVSDTGIGMDKKTMSRIFEPFFTTKAMGKGTGLGLATVYGIVKQNGGFINVYSEPGRGATFKIYLPRHPGGEEAREAGQAAGPPTGSGRVLLVEDDDLVRQVAAAMLEELGYSVFSRKTPAQALEACREPGRRFDLLLTDVVMPEMSGKELRDAVLPLQAGIGVLFMSGYTSNVIVKHGVLEEGVNFLPKPFNIGDLAAKVAQALA